MAGPGDRADPPGAQTALSGVLESPSGRPIPAHVTPRDVGHGTGFVTVPGQIQTAVYRNDACLEQGAARYAESIPFDHSGRTVQRRKRRGDAVARCGVPAGEGGAVLE